MPQWYLVCTHCHSAKSAGASASFCAYTVACIHVISNPVKQSIDLSKSTVIVNYSVAISTISNVFSLLF